MNRRWLSIGLILASLGLSVLAEPPATPAGAADFFFKDGDAVVMLGDSITEQYLYSTYVELWTITRFPSWSLTFRNVGIGGDTANGGKTRFQRDVVPHKPTALTVDFGMNDGGYGAFITNNFNSYAANLQAIANQAQSNKIRVAWLTPQPVEKPEEGPAVIAGYNLTLERYAEGVKSVAATNNGLFVDQFHPYAQVMEKARAADPKNRIGGGDAVHPGVPGQTVMASAILKGMNFPSLVSDAGIDAAALKVTKAEKCQITDLAMTADSVLQFKRLDAALPFFPEAAKPVLQWTPILEDLNDYRLRVTGLKPGQYEIRLGGKKVAEYADTALAQGVNLAACALTSGPVADQVKAVVSAVQAKNDYFHASIFRGVTLAAVNVPDWFDPRIDAAAIDSQRKAAFEKRLEEMPRYDAAIRKALIIQPHLVEIVPVAKP